MTQAISRSGIGPLLSGRLEGPVSLSFRDNSSLRTAAWAVQAFGAKALGDWYYAKKRVIARSEANQSELTEGELDERAQKVGHDLITAVERRGRGYELNDMPVRGAIDSAVVLGALKKAARLNSEAIADIRDIPESSVMLVPGGPSEADTHFQANAKWMLDNVIKTEGPNQSRDFIV